MLISFQQLRELRHDDHPETIVVIGSGAVGLYLATSLSRARQRVLLLEAGSRDLGGFSTATFASIGRPHQGIDVSRSRTLGGTTNLWGGQLVEFMPADVQERSWPGGEAWPLPFSQLKGYYRETYTALGVSEKVLDDAFVWRRLGIQPTDLGPDLEIFLTRWMRIPNLATLYATEIESDPNLIIATEATVRGFEFVGDRVVAVEASDGNGQHTRVSGLHFVLAAGTIENARLLLHAAVAPDCPWRDNRMLGRRFQDHLGGRVADVIPHSMADFSKVFATLVVDGEKLQPKIRTTNRRVSTPRQLNIQGMMAFESSISENLVFLKQFVKAALYRRRIGSFRSLLTNSIACSRYLLPLMWNYVVRHRLLIPRTATIALHVQSETIPLDDSRISIDHSSVDRYGLPKVVLDWRISGQEFASIRAFAEEVSRALAGLADVRIVPDLAAGDHRFLDRLYDTGHQAGGCVMGSSAGNGVVDRDLRVFGTTNLYVAGAGVFRSCGNANTTFTAMTLATRLKDHLVNRLHATGRV